MVFFSILELGILLRFSCGACGFVVVLLGNMGFCCGFVGEHGKFGQNKVFSRNIRVIFSRNYSFQIGFETENLVGEHGIFLWFCWGTCGYVVVLLGNMGNMVKLEDFRKIFGEILQNI